MEPIAQFITELLHAAKLDALPERARAEASLRIQQQIERRIGLVAIANLDDDGIVAYTEMVEHGPPSSDEMQAFLTERIPDFDIKIRAALDAFATEFIEAATAPRSSS